MTTACLTTIIVLLSALVGLISTRLEGPDNEVEQMAEVVIKTETGMDIDLSPEEGESNAAQEVKK